MRLVFALALLVSAAAAYDLPQDSKAVVITLDQRGGYGPRLPPQPMLEICGDGTVRTYGKATPGKLTPKELQELLGFIVKKQRFFEHKNATVSGKVRQILKNQKVSASIVDAATTTITVRLEKKSGEAGHHALAWAAQQYPGVPELARLAAIEKRLQVILTVARAGGSASANKILALANKRLRVQHPLAKPLALADLRSYGTMPDGRKRFWFYRSANGASVSVGILLPEKGEPEIKVELNQSVR